MLWSGGFRTLPTALPTPCWGGWERLCISRRFTIGTVFPIHGALVTAMVAAVIIGLVSLRAKQREDTVISALWAVGMAVGIIFISRTPGYSEDLMGYLFGNILMVSSNDLWMLAGLDGIIVITGLLFYNQFLAVCFDHEFAGYEASG